MSFYKLLIKTEKIREIKYESNISSIQYVQRSQFCKILEVRWFKVANLVVSQITERQR